MRVNDLLEFASLNPVTDNCLLLLSAILKIVTSDKVSRNLTVFC